MKMQSLLLACLLAAVPAHAALVTESGTDFLPTYTGPLGGDLNAVSSEVTYDFARNTFVITGTMNAPIGTTTGAFYVWGLNRGAGTERFNTGALPVGAGVTFDLVVILRPDGTGQVNSLVGAATTILSPGSVVISGNTISSIPLPSSLFPTRGFALENYTWNLWPRVTGVAGNASISDFIPDASNAPVTVIPEPAALAPLATAILLVGRRRR